jgi:hypothetical protein
MTLLLLAILGWTVALYVFFLAYVTLMAARKNGKLAAAPRIVQGVAYSVLIVAWVLDVAFNFVIGSLIFLEAPNLRRLTFTNRCGDHMSDLNWRGRIARWVCQSWLNPFDDGHCGG